MEILEVVGEVIIFEEPVVDEEVDVLGTGEHLQKFEILFGPAFDSFQSLKFDPLFHFFILPWFQVANILILLRLN